MILDRIFQSFQKKQLLEAQDIINKINQLEHNVSKLTHEEMKKKISNFSKDIQQNKVTLDLILPEVFALAREASVRTIGKRHFDSQLIGGYIIHKAMIAEMKTGEGKTLVATLPAILNALTGKKIYIVTVNDYLAKRDSEILAPIYKYLGFSVGYVLSTCNQSVKQQAYSSDIIYITNNEICFDYLKDNMIKNINQRLQKNHYFAIIDEIDNILIDEARTPLIISGPDNENTDLYNLINPAISLLNKDDYEVDHKNKSASLKNSGFDKIEEYLQNQGIIDHDLFSENIDKYHIVSNLIKAHFGMMRDRDYVVMKDEVVIIDEFTGRLTEGRKFSKGLHQALEAKERVSVKKGSQTNASITYTNFFRLFEKLAGMTGTASSESDEFSEIYNLKVVSVPTNRPIIRKDDNLVRLYHKKKEMYLDALKIISEKHANGQPMLICTPSVYDSEDLSNFLYEAQLPHHVLNAKNHEQEAKIVSQAGKLNAITIATNMAGRGTDIILGGCSESAFKEMLINNPEINEEEYYRTTSASFRENRSKVLEAGGLFVLILGVLESEKARMQFIGRSGRQGDPGESIYMASLEDDLMLPLHKDALNIFFIKLYFPDRCNINSKAQSIIMDIQNMYQSHFFEIRKNTLKYDDIVNLQREQVYFFRDYILTEVNIKELAIRLVKMYINDVKNLNKFDRSLFQFIIEEVNSFEEVQSKILEKFETHELTTEELRMILLDGFDEKWFELINLLEDLKKTVHLVSMAQKDPFFTFKEESFKFFEEMIRDFIANISKAIYENDSNLEVPDFEKMFSSIGNNSCFCGSEKIFIECHGNIENIGNNTDINNMDINIDENNNENTLDFQNLDKEIKKMFSDSNQNILNIKNPNSNMGDKEQSMNDIMKSMEGFLKEFENQMKNNNLDNETITVKEKYNEKKSIPINNEDSVINK